MKVQDEQDLEDEIMDFVKKYVEESKLEDSIIEERKDEVDEIDFIISYDIDEVTAKTNTFRALLPPLKKRASYQVQEFQFEATISFKFMEFLLLPYFKT